MKGKLLGLFAAAFGLVVLASPVLAHHGDAAFDTSKVTTVKGTVTAYEFVNPHAQLYFDVKDAKGVEKWGAQLPGPEVLAKKGWTRSTLKPGDEITISGNPAKNGSTALRYRKIVLPNGQILDSPAGGDNY